MLRVSRTKRKMRAGECPWYSGNKYYSMSHKRRKKATAQSGEYHITGDAETTKTLVRCSVTQRPFRGDQLQLGARQHPVEEICKIRQRERACHSFPCPSSSLFHSCQNRVHAQVGRCTRTKAAASVYAHPKSVMLGAGLTSLAMAAAWAFPWGDARSRSLSETSPGERSIASVS